MPENFPKSTNESDGAATLHKLMPTLAGQQRIENSVVHAEKHGDSQARANSERRIGAHLARLVKLLQREGVEARVWNSAVEELVIKHQDIPNEYWEQQKQIARDNGLGDIHLGQSEKENLTGQLREAQRTGLRSWRDYLESTGDQYPVWFKFYAWDGMSRLGTFDKKNGYYSKRSKGTVAPYPQLNPAALSKVFEAVKNSGGDDQTIAKLIKSGNFNRLYSHMLLNQKAILPTPEKPEDVHGEWREYTSDNIQAITAASEGTPWCITGHSMADQYTRGGGKFLLFHLQDPETGKTSPTAAASIRLDQHGRVAELSGLKGGANQYIEDSLIPTVHEKVKHLPGGKKYLQAFEDKQMLIQMDRKFKNGESFSIEELLFLYEDDRPIEHIHAHREDPRINQFKTNKSQHIRQIAEREKISMKQAELIATSPSELEANLERFLKNGYDPSIIAHKLRPESRFQHLDRLLEAGAWVDLEELYSQLEPVMQLKAFSKLQEKLQKRGVRLDPDELARKFRPTEQIENFKALSNIGAKITPDDIANSFSNEERFYYLSDLSRIGAKVDVDGLLRELKPNLAPGDIGICLKAGANLETIKEMFVLYLGGDRDLGDTARSLMESGLSSDEVMSFLASVKTKGFYGNTENFNRGDTSHDRIPALLSSGVDPNAILQSKVFDHWHIEHAMAKLLSAGANPDKLMKGLGAYYTAEKIDALLQAGFKIGDIVRHIQPEPKYILGKFEELNKNGANLSIEGVIAAMKPMDVLYEIEEALRLGANIDVNEFLDNPGVNNIAFEHIIDKLLALGADPQKIADKLNLHLVGYNHQTGRINDYDRDADRFRHKYPKIYKLAYDRMRKQMDAKNV